MDLSTQTVGSSVAVRLDITGDSLVLIEDLGDLLGRRFCGDVNVPMATQTYGILPRLGLALGRRLFPAVLLQFGFEGPSGIARLLLQLSLPRRLHHLDVLSEGKQVLLEGFFVIGLPETMRFGDEQLAVELLLGIPLPLARLLRSLHQLIGILRVEVKADAGILLRFGFSFCHGLTQSLGHFAACDETLLAWVTPLGTIGSKLQYFPIEVLGEHFKIQRVRLRGRQSAKADAALSRVNSFHVFATCGPSLEFPKVAYVHRLRDAKGLLHFQRAVYFFVVDVRNGPAKGFPSAIGGVLPIRLRANISVDRMRARLPASVIFCRMNPRIVVPEHVEGESTVTRYCVTLKVPPRVCGPGDFRKPWVHHGARVALRFGLGLGDFALALGVHHGARIPNQPTMSRSNLVLPEHNLVDDVLGVGRGAPLLKLLQNTVVRHRSDGVLVDDPNLLDEVCFLCAAKCHGYFRSRESSL